jgi:hypothetical protein
MGIKRSAENGLMLLEFTFLFIFYRKNSRKRIYIFNLHCAPRNKDNCSYVPKQAQTTFERIVLLALVLI